MLLEVRRFRQRVQRDIRGLVADLQAETGRRGNAEAEAWENSLPVLARACDGTGLERFHLQFGEDAGIDVEYRMPAAAHWCDAVLLGRGPDGPAAVMFELKHWDSSTDRPGPRARLIRRHADLVLHPSAQVEGYVEYCRSFHSVVLEEKARVDGCVLLTRPGDPWAYQSPPHGDLVREYPIFTPSETASGGALSVFLRQRLVRPDLSFAQRFARGQYKQDRNFIQQVSRSIRAGTREFVLLDAQRRGFELCLQRVREALDTAGDEGRVVILIEGPPGSGKSVLAAHLWAELAQWPELGSGCVVVTTSGAQRSNWEHLFTAVAGRRAGAGVVMPANAFNPGLSLAWVAESRRRGQSVEYDTWQGNLALFLASGHRPRLADRALSVAIVDEAHALIDPSGPGARGVAASGWVMHAGPQAWHVMRASRVSIFLMDPQQSYRENELTTPRTIAALAKAQGIRHVEQVNLGDAQFRCGGSPEYVAWVEELLVGRPATELSARPWRAHGATPGPFRFETVATPQGLEDALRREIDTGRRARIVASYARKWVTKKLVPHNLMPTQQDFQLVYTTSRGPRVWYRPWNHAPGMDYTRWVQAPPGTPMFDDPLCEVGCPYVVRGFDYDIIGLLWLEDLVWRKDRWEVSLEHVHETGLRLMLTAAKRGSAAHREAVLERVRRGYRILLTRAIRGIYAWIADDETRAHVEAALR